MNKLVRAWYAGHPLVWLLLPFSLLFWLLSRARRWAFKCGLKHTYRPNAKVVVVGNISVGGNGKTPVVLALAEHYKNKGIRVGILSRGYGGTSSFYPRVVRDLDDANEVGDEPRLLAIRSQVPVVIDPVRSRGAQYLESQLHCELILCDDGLQHYALARDVEIIVMDERLMGSGYLMPMGPLREGGWRLCHVDALVHNRADNTLPAVDAGDTQQYLMTLMPGTVTSVTQPNQTLSVTALEPQSITAIAGIGSPERFFTQLKAMGIVPKQTVPFPDHYQYTPEDIPSGTVIMTEKDAVKVKQFAHDQCWYLPVSAQISTDFYTQLDKKLADAGLHITP